MRMDSLFIGELGQAINITVLSWKLLFAWLFCLILFSKHLISDLSGFCHLR
jgi:hypothetical protein